MVNLGILTVDASASSDDDEYDATEFTHRSSTSGRSPFFLHTKYVWDRPESDDEDEDCSTSMGATQRRTLSGTASTSAPVPVATRAAATSTATFTATFTATTPEAPGRRAKSTPSF